MFRAIHAATADNLWLQAHAWYKDGTATMSEGGRNGLTAEVLHAALSLSDPRQRWIASREPALNPAFALAEVIWIVQGRQDAAFLNYFNPRLPQFAGYGSTYSGAYGHRLRRRMGFDQLGQAAAALTSNPLSRQVVLQIWDAVSDLPEPDGSPRSPDVPCNLASMLKVRNGRLEWTQVMRSNDLILGLPHNLVQFTSLQEIMAGWIGMEVGTYNHLSDSLHVYERDFQSIAQLKRQVVPTNPDDLRLPPSASAAVFDELEINIELMVSVTASTRDLIRQLGCSSLPVPYRNWLALLTADACRRRQDVQAAVIAADACINPCFTFLWQRWCERQRC